MTHRSVRRLSLLGVLVCLTAGCGGADPLRFRPNSKKVGPWCAPNQRVRIGDRVVGTVGFGENKYKDFLVDEAGREYDPERLADRVWAYCERTGDAERITDAFRRDGSYPRLVVVAVKPVVVVLETHRPSASPRQPGASYDRSFWVAQVHAMGDPAYQDGLQWLSPDLGQRPTPLVFSPAGVAEIALTPGVLKLTRDAGGCKTTRK